MSDSPDPTGADGARPSGRRRRGRGRGRGRPGGAPGTGAPHRKDRGPDERTDPAFTALRDELRGGLDTTMLRDAHRLARRVDRARTLAALESAATEVSRSAQRAADRAASLPKITYPEQLPVSARRDDLATAIAENQVVIVAGETGSGKTTQLPKICLELGRGVRGLIGHTQPRRLAARSVSERIAEELDRPLGDTVGYTVRFTDKVSDHTLVKVMTDGILLNEIQRDRLLRSYDTLIIDEAHERSLNIDFLLGYLRQLLPKRPDLKLIITSATIDPERFAAHFAVDGKPAPIVEVSGRTYPVEVRYRPLTEQVGDRTVDRDPVEAICDAAAELIAEGPGDILVFLSGEREIRDAADALAKRKFAGTEILPLYARLSSAEQQRVFRPHRGRRIVLSTNVAETSLTVPSIRYVIDTGKARISRYSARTKVQRLPIEDVSQASADQRAGRCGRVADGICIRLYDEDDYLARPEFTEPEILRTNLASVVLQMTALGLGDTAAFPFVEPPDQRAIRDGVALLDELGALAPAKGGDPVRTLTETGTALARLPVDPRMGRMLLEGHRLGALTETLIIVAAISMQDVRERPADHQQAADQQHARFHVPGSDFLSYLKLWEYLREQRRELSGSRYRRMCRDEFLHFMRIREWQDLTSQLRQITREMNWTANDSPADPDTIHQALLSGLLSQIGMREGETREYLGARGARFAVFPGSGQAKKPPRFLMAGELVETSRLWGRTVARIEPAWAERLAGDLVKRQYSEPHWSTKRAAAMAYETVTLYGVPLVSRRLVGYGRIDPEVSRELFIRHALVQGEWETPHEFFHRNRELLDDVEALEHRARRRDIVVTDDELFDFYDHRIGAEVVSARHFDTWWKKARRQAPDLLDFEQATVTNVDAAPVAATDFPEVWQQGGVRFPLAYRFEPGAEDDGVTARIPIEVLAQLAPVGFDWLVPGMRQELAVALIKSLPKAQRRAVVPAPDFAAAALAAVRPRSEPIVSALAGALTRITGAPIRSEDFRPDQLPAHLRMRFVIVDASGAELAAGEDLAALQHLLAEQMRTASARHTADAARPATLEWTSETIGEIPEKVTSTVDGHTVVGFPALQVADEGTERQAPVGVTVVATAAEQRALMREGTRQLLLNALPGPPKSLLTGLDNKVRLVLAQYPHGGAQGLLEEAYTAAVDELMGADPAVRDAEAFTRLRTHIAGAVTARTSALLLTGARVTAQWGKIQRLLPTAAPDTAEDVRAQVQDLVYPGFLLAAGPGHASHLPRYLAAAAARLEAVPSGARIPLSETTGVAVLDRVYAALQRHLDTAAPEAAQSAEVAAVHWSIEELRVSLFAQHLGTAQTVSEKRIVNAIAQLR